MQNFIYSGPLFYVMGRILCTITLFEFKDMVGWMPNIIGLILSVIILILFILISPLEVMGNKKKRESTYE
jgi:hypothetical protein